MCSYELLNPHLLYFYKLTFANGLKATGVPLKPQVHELSIQCRLTTGIGKSSYC